MNSRFPTVENNWPRLYREYPWIYDRFAHLEWKNSSVFDCINSVVNLHGKLLVDVGAGTGRSTIPLAKYTELVIGIEPEKQMYQIARKNIESLQVRNVVMVQGSSNDLPIKNKLFDVVTCFMSISVLDIQAGKRLIENFSRMLKNGGHIVHIGCAPGWYGGNLNSVILGDSRATQENMENVESSILKELGFSYEDVFTTQYFLSPQDAVETFGFIFGEKSIRYILENQICSILWKFRVSFLMI